ncbi:MAG: outer membrane lipoprotein-sorting protein [Verrucomicrobiales bacterium]|nr:outer membrane lipoprotein-sorting protein [Verrucomicrobiales bacterium]
MRSTTRIGFRGTWIWLVLAVLAGGWAWEVCGAAEATVPAFPDARTLVAALVKSQSTSGYRTRARVAIEPAQGPERHYQVLIKGRRDAAVSETLVLVLWPREEKGRAWMIRRDAAGVVGGFRLAPGGASTPIRSEDLDEPLLGSDLGIDDFAETFWEWADASVVGEEKVGGTACWIVESRSGDPSVRHPRIRSWLAKEKSVAMRVEKYDAADVLRKRLTAGRVVRRDEGGWVAAEWTVETVGRGGQTRVTGSRSDRGLELPAVEFTPEAISKLVE